MRIFYWLVLSLVAAGCATNLPSSNSPVPRSDGQSAACAPAGNAAVRTTMYFGLSQPKGVVTEQEWQTFLRDQVTPRFPHGLTVWEADGQWRLPDGTISRERAKVLLLIHDGTPPALQDLGAIVGAYRKRFDQESVLWESAPVCAAF